MTRWFLGGAVACIAIAMAACGGGGGGSSSTPPVNGAQISGSAVLLIPNTATTSSNARKPAFLSASTQSVGVTVNGGTPAYSNVGASSALCTTTSSGRSCAIPLTAPVGSDTFVFTLYDGQSGGGNVLGSGTAVQTVTQGVSFTVNVAVGGTIASIALTAPVIDVGPTSVPLGITVKDADGNTIIGSGTYPNPIALTDSDPTGTLTLSTSTVTSPSTNVMLNYSGGSLASAVHIGASASGVASSAVTPASLLPLNYFPVNITRTFTYSGSSVNANGPNFIPIGGAQPMPTVTPEAYTGTYTQSISSGVTFNGVANAQAIVTIDNSTGATPDINDISDSIYYQALENGVMTALGQTYTPALFASTTTITNGRPIVALPFITGATTTTPFESFTTVANGSSQISPSMSVNGVTTETSTLPDGSEFIQIDRSDGTGQVTATPGTGPCPNPATGAQNWDSGLPCAASAATVNVSAPAGGFVSVAESITESGSTNSATNSFPESDLYPNGILPTVITETVGAPLATAPAPCAVVPNVSGPIIPVTTVNTSSSPAQAGTVTFTEVEYLAPGVGDVCITFSFSSLSAALADSVLSGFPPVEPSYLYQYYGSETDSLAAVGPATQPGTVVVTGGPRRAAGSRMAQYAQTLFLRARINAGMRLTR